MVSSLANGYVWPLSHSNLRKTRRISFGIMEQEMPCQIPRILSTTRLRRVLRSLLQLQKSPAAPLNSPASHNAPIVLLLHRHHPSLKTNSLSIRQAWVLVTVRLTLVVVTSRGPAHDVKPLQQMVTSLLMAPSTESRLVLRRRRTHAVRSAMLPRRH